MRQLVQRGVFFLFCFYFSTVSSVNKRECRQIFAFFFLSLADSSQTMSHLYGGTVTAAIDDEQVGRYALLLCMRMHSPGKWWSIAQATATNISCRFFGANYFKNAAHFYKRDVNLCVMGSRFIPKHWASI